MESAFNQQRVKLKPESLEVVFYESNSMLLSPYKLDIDDLIAKRILILIFHQPYFASYFISEGHSTNWYYSIQINLNYSRSSKWSPHVKFIMLLHDD